MIFQSYESRRLVEVYHQKMNQKYSKYCVFNYVIEKMIDTKYFELSKINEWFSF